ncbi:ergosterol biosynthesis ERG4/ERG24 family-domain-containing protein, partial [Piptocephalis cylindrospora]
RAATTAAATDLNPWTKEKEFFGIPGVMAIIFLTHFFALFFQLNCSPEGCPSPLFYQGKTFPGILPLWDTLFSWEVTFVYLGWLGLIILLWTILPGKWVQGTVLRDGNQLLYKENGWSTLVAIAGGSFGTWYLVGSGPFLYLFNHTVQLVTAACLITFVVSTMLYLASLRSGNVLLATGGNTGNALYDWFIGRELNPRIGLLDIKQVVEQRPNLIGWLVMNLACLVRHYEGMGGRVSNAMVLVQLFEVWYIADSLWNEHTVLTTMDITTDGFGWMLAFGNFVWVPFTYGLQARFLADPARAVDLPLWALLGICGVQAIGYTIFRGANGEKDSFRRNPD